MRITSESGESFIQLTRVDSQHLHFSSVCLEVTIEDRGFHGVNDRVWFEQQACRNFLQDLSSLDQQRQGEARLQSMSPGECVLRIGSIDRAGHLAAYYTLVRGDLIGNMRVERSVGGAFLLDPSVLASIRRDLEETIGGTYFA